MLPLADGIDQVDASIFKQVLQILAWLATGGLGLWLGKSWGAKGTKESPVAIEQPLNVQKHDAPAKKSEHDTLKEAVTKLTTELQSFKLSKAEDDLALSQQLAAQFNKMTTDGQARAAAISQEISEVLAVQNQRNITIAADIAKHTAEIESLKASDFRHNGEIARIQENITKILTGNKRS